MKEEVTDRFGLVWFIFVLLGTGTLLPFNVFLTEKEFYDVRLQVPPFNSFVVDNFMSLFAISFNVLNLCALGLLIKYQKFLSLRVLVLQPLVITFIMLVSTAALAVKVDLSGEMMAKYTLPSIGLMGLCTAFLQGGVLQLASIFSAAHIRGAVTGISVGGVLTSALSFGSQLSAPENEGGTHSAADVAPAALLYFSASAAVIAACIIGYSALPLLPYGRYKLLLAGIIDDPKERKLMTVDDDYEEPLLTVVESEDARFSAGTSRTEHTRAAIISVETDFSMAARSWQWRNAFNIYCIALFVCFLVTMGLHPGITSFICSTQNAATVSPCASNSSAGRIFGDLFVPLLYVLFNVGDFFGRILAGYGPWSHGAPAPFSLLTYSILRAGIALTILFCHIITPTSWKLPEYLDHDAYPFALITMLGLTQGHLISTICMHAPSTLLPTEMSKYGPVTSFAISMGSFLGSFVALGLGVAFQTHEV